MKINSNNCFSKTFKHPGQSRKWPVFQTGLRSILLLFAIMHICILQINAQPPLSSGNPILPGYDADPDIQHFNGKYYIYPTGGTQFKAWSSTDLTNWVNEGVIFDLGPQCSWANVNGWARM